MLVFQQTALLLGSLFLIGLGLYKAISRILR